MAEPGEPSRISQSICPICRKPSEPAIRPFCSKRCADIDLHRWLSGRYAVPAERLADDDGSSDTAQPNEKP